MTRCSPQIRHLRHWLCSHRQYHRSPILRHRRLHRRHQNPPQNPHPHHSHNLHHPNLHRSHHLQTHRLYPSPSAAFCAPPTSQAPARALFQRSDASLESAFPFRARVHAPRNPTRTPSSAARTPAQAPLRERLVLFAGTSPGA